MAKIKKPSTGPTGGNGDNPYAQTPEQIAKRQNRRRWHEDRGVVFRPIDPSLTKADQTHRDLEDIRGETLPPEPSPEQNKVELAGLLDSEPWHKPRKPLNEVR